MTTDLSEHTYISPLGIYRIYRELAEDGKIPPGSRAWVRMEMIYEERLSMKEKEKCHPLNIDNKEESK